MLGIPGIGVFYFAGPILAAIGAIITGFAFGGITGSLIGIGLAELHAARYERKIRNGAILMAIHVDDRDQRSHARRILAGWGATNITTVGERYVHQPGAHSLAS